MDFRSITGCVLVFSLVLGQFGKAQDTVVAPQPAASEDPSVVPPAPAGPPVATEVEATNPTQPDAKPVSNHPQVVIAPEVELAKDMSFRGGGPKWWGACSG
jgi:hypothetical protein